MIRAGVTNLWNRKRTKTFFDRVPRDFRRNKKIYLLALPGILYYLIFHYIPMVGVTLAFREYSPALGFFAGNWVGFENFNMFFNSYYFTRLVGNTFLLNFFNILFGFPMPIILALMLNEVQRMHFRKTIQTITYMPHFISLVVICGMVLDFTSEGGIINTLIELLGGSRVNLMLYSGNFRPVYIISDIWQQVGWNSIIYIAAIAGIDQEQYEAAKLDGANRFQQIMHITLPGIAPTIIILLILKIGSMMNVGFEKIILLYNPSIYDTADVISSFVYRKGILQADYSYSTAVGLFNSGINFALLIIANSLSKRLSGSSLW